MALAVKDGKLVRNPRGPGEPDALSGTCGAPPEPWGACCVPADGGQYTCIDNTPSECAALGGEWHEGEVCADDPCTPEDVLGACNACNWDWNEKQYNSEAEALAACPDVYDRCGGADCTAIQDGEGFWHWMVAVPYCSTDYRSVCDQVADHPDYFNVTFTPGVDCLGNPLSKNPLP